MQRSYITCILLTALITVAATKPVQSQYVLKQADDQALLYNYALAIPLYNKAFKKKASLQAARGLAESYRLTNNYVFAESWYAKVVAMADHAPQDKFHYAEVLMNNSKYAEAREILDQYLQQMPQDMIAVNMREGCVNAVKWLTKPVPGNLENMKSLNSQWSDWGTAFFNGKIIFASDRPYDSLRKPPFFSNSSIKRSVYNWTGNGYLHLYETDGLDSSSTRLLGRNINGDYHSATASYTGNGNAMYYAVTSLVKKGRSFLGKEEPYTLNVAILNYKKDSSGAWERSSTFPYNAVFNYSVGDPWISPDGRTLFFVADYGAKGSGGTDIYYSVQGVSGEWSEPVNMGPEINTAGDERTPFFDNDGVFYFASNGRAGMGGLDIYKSVKGKREDHWIVENMGSPVNSPQDDFAPAMNGTSLYFSSNRLSGKGSDDIYRFDAAKVPALALSGRVMDKQTGVPLSNAVLTLKNKQTGTSLQAITDSEGRYHFQLDSLNHYDLSITKTDYSSVTGITVTVKDGLRKDIVLERAEINKPSKIENIYFDLDKSDIRPDGIAELDKLARLLNDNPTWEVEISSHTDTRANDKYNLKLSQRRAESTVAYLVSKGISKERLIARGYGESRLINRCGNGVECSEEEHQANRRTEFTILDK